MGSEEMKRSCCRGRHAAAPRAGSDGGGVGWTRNPLARLVCRVALGQPAVKLGKRTTASLHGPDPPPLPQESQRWLCSDKFLIHRHGFQALITRAEGPTVTSSIGRSVVRCNSAAKLCFPIFPLPSASGLHFAEGNQLDYSVLEIV